MEKGKYHKAIIGLKSGAIGGAVGGATIGLGYAMLFYILPNSLSILMDVTKYPANWTLSLVLVGVIIGILAGRYMAKASNGGSRIGPVLGGIASMLFVWIIVSPSLRDVNWRDRILTTVSVIGIILSGMVIGAPVGGIAGAILGTAVGITNMTDRPAVYPLVGSVTGLLLMSPLIYFGIESWSDRIYVSIVVGIITTMMSILCGVLGGVIARRMYKRLGKHETTEATRA